MFGSEEIPNNSPAWGGVTPDMFSILSSFGSNGGGAEMPAMSAFEQATIDNQSRQLDIMGQMNQPMSGFQKGVGTFGTITQGLASLGNIYMGLKNMKLQKEAFKFNKGVTNTNLNNSIMDYNRRLGDTLANRALNNGQGSGWVSEQLAKYSAKRS